MTSLFEIGEDQLIAIFAGAGAKPDGALAIENGDDAAAWAGATGEAMVATTDSLVEGVHFDRAWAALEDVGRKLVAVNLSDVAAMGATPRLLLLSITWPLAVST